VGARIAEGAAHADWLEYVDRATGIYRAAYVVNDKIEACVFISPRPDLPPRGWVSVSLPKPALDDATGRGF